MTMNKGNSVDGCLPKFFKVYLPGESGDDLKLPISFNSYIPKHLPKNVIVKSIYGNIWKFELRRCCGDDVERFVMVNGWKSIVKDEDLTGGEFLVFEFDGSRLFHFCIYGHTTCKRLRILVPTKETEDKSDGGEDKSIDDIIVLSDDDDDDQGEEDKSSEDTIVMGDVDSDDVNDVQDYGGQDKSSDKVTVLSDGDDDDDDQDYGDGDDSEDADYYCASDDYADDKDVDVVDSDVEVDDDADAYDGDDRKYLDDPENPSFKKTLNPKRKSQLRIPAYVIKDYNLNFSESITIIDPLVKKSGTLLKKIKIQKNGSVFVTGFGSVIRRNQVKTTDKMIFELKKTGANLVHTIKVYIIKA